MKLKKLVELLENKKELKFYLKNDNDMNILVSIYRKNKKNYIYRRLFFGYEPQFRSLKEIRTDNILRYIRSCYNNDMLKDFKIKG